MSKKLPPNKIDIAIYRYPYINLVQELRALVTFRPSVLVPWAFLTHLGAKWMPELDSERHFAPDCISRMSGSSSESPKPNIVDKFE